MDKIAVLIPCYNEAQTIGKVVRDFRDVLPEATIYVYDNNSTDETARLAAEAGAVVRPAWQQGKGHVVRRMFQEIEAECYIITDGDDTYPADAAREMAALILESQRDMVVGDRLSSTYFTENKRRFHNFGNSLVRSAINSIFHSEIKDIMTGYRAFSYRFVKTFPVLSKGFEVETEMTIHAINMDIGLDNVIISYRDRPEGSESKLNTISDGVKVLKTILNLFRSYRPLRFFSWVAGILAVIALVVFIFVVWLPFRNTGIVEHMPTLIVCGFVGLAALLSLFTGLILDAIRIKERREFEFRLLQAERMKQQEYVLKTLHESDPQEPDFSDLGSVSYSSAASKSQPQTYS